MATQNSLTKRTQKAGLSTYMTQDAVKNQINSIMGGKDGNKFMASVVSAVQANPALQECSNPSIVSAALLGHSLNLSPSPQLGQYYMVPYYNNNKKCKEAQFQLGYKGYIQLAIRSGQYKKLNVLAIKEGELINYDPLEESIEVKLIEDDEEREGTPTIGYYAMFECGYGFRKVMYWSKKKMESHAKKYSKGYAKDLKDNTAYTFWAKDFDGMAYKTMLRQLISKWGYMSIDLQAAVESDMSVIRDDGSVEYVDTEPLESAEVVPEHLHTAELPDKEEKRPHPEPVQNTQDFTPEQPDISTHDAVQSSFFS